MSATCVDLPIYLSGLERNVQASRSALSMYAAAVDHSQLPLESAHAHQQMRCECERKWSWFLWSNALQSSVPSFACTMTSAT